ncbi:hypothetical protein [Streptomyces sp. CB02959]|uniref:hypothetical protein n=1 Tax=Streptomyces sp. CB02959 TaxID=2020330 RepID=UPI002152ACFA|nr:hypothetical protein [Streptomyces sp. CB02959]
MVDIVEIYVHWYAGRSKSQVSASLRVDRKTIRKYLSPAEAAGITPGGPPMSEVDWAKLLKSWFTELASRRLNQVRWAEIEPHRDQGGLRVHAEGGGDELGVHDVQPRQRAPGRQLDSSRPAAHGAILDARRPEHAAGLRPAHPRP